MTNNSPPLPYGAIPTPQQLAWHALEYYGFIHFTVNTFTDREWGQGDEQPSVFQPTSFSADQIVETAALGGMRGLILTAKHHDGFCLWPTAFTDHSVRSSPWRGGKGDVVGEISEACAKYGLKFGVYLSPWDRHHPEYARPGYISYYHSQLRELLTRYGPVFEVWFDGANGGDGYYGGKYERRQIDARTYYEWEKTFALVRELQPEACIFGGAPGADIRWVGNERGTAGDPCWHTFHGEPVEDDAGLEALNTGHRGGALWYPAECDVSIRPGWFYHAREDLLVRSPQNLLDLYFQSVGRGANLLLNLPPTRHGLIHERDRAALIAFRQLRDAFFTNDLAAGASVSASSTRGGLQDYAPENLVDGSRDTFWCSDDSVTDPEVTLHFEQPVTFNVVSLREFLPLGQRVERFALDAWQNGDWLTIYTGSAIGSRQLARLPDHTTTALRLRVTRSPACPALSAFSLHYAPPNPERTLLDWFYQSVFPHIP